MPSYIQNVVGGNSYFADRCLIGPCFQDKLGIIDNESFMERHKQGKDTLFVVILWRLCSLDREKINLDPRKKGFIKDLAMIPLEMIFIYR